MIKGSCEREPPAGWVASRWRAILCGIARLFPPRLLPTAIDDATRDHGPSDHQRHVCDGAPSNRQSPTPTTDELAVMSWAMRSETLRPSLSTHCGPEAVKCRCRAAPRRIAPSTSSAFSRWFLTRRRWRAKEAAVCTVMSLLPGRGSVESVVVVSPLGQLGHVPDDFAIPPLSAVDAQLFAGEPSDGLVDLLELELTLSGDFGSSHSALEQLVQISHRFLHFLQFANEAIALSSEPEPISCRVGGVAEFR